MLINLNLTTYSVNKKDFKTKKLIQIYLIYYKTKHYLIITHLGIFSKKGLLNKDNLISEQIEKYEDFSDQQIVEMILLLKKSNDNF